MTISSGLLIAGAGASLACVISGFLLLQEQTQNDRVRRRLEAVVPNQERSSKQTVTLFQTSGGKKAEFVHQLTGLFGFDIAKSDQYPMQWWLVLVIAWLIACVAGYVSSGMLGSFVTFIVPIFFIFFSRIIFGFFKGRRQDKLFRQFPDALAMIVRSVRVGIPVSEAIRAVSREAPLPTSPEFFRLAEEISIGVPLDEALHTMAERNDMAEYRFFATALTLQAQTGGALSETLENLADVIRKRVALRERGSALASEAKTSATVLGCLPVAAALGLWFLNPQYLNVLFTEKAGHIVLGACVGLLGTGVLVMRTIIKKSLQ